MAEIRFLLNEARKVEGLGYSGFETFKGSPYKSCARETGQNSRDAASGLGTVNVRFTLHRIARQDIPFADQLQRAIECCMREPRDDNTQQHLTRAHQTIRAEEINVLEISDRNTTGLTGSTTDANSVFSALVKGDGVTNKAEATSAGSFGIGKNAAVAVSDLQTVIYSTRYADAGTNKEKFAAQGRLRLISHQDAGRAFSAEGYWGGADFTAIEDVAAVPRWMARDDIGTSIFAIGFREHENWAERMALSLATNFFLAIERKEIEFSVGEKHVINQESIASVLASKDLEAIATETDQLEDLRRARRLFECLRSESSKTQTIVVPNLGNFTLHLLIEQGMPRELHVLRNGIYITDNFAKFSEPMRRFPGVREFTSFLEPARNKDGLRPSALLKRLENPAHDAFEPERIISSAERDAAKKQIKSLIRQAREAIREAARMEDVSSSHLDELSNLFADISDRGRKAVEEDPDLFIYGAARKGRRARPPGTTGNGTGKGRGSRQGEGSGKRSASSSQHAIPLRELRSILPNVDDERTRRVFFTPETGGDIQIAVSASGLGGAVELPIVAASQGSVAGGRLAFSVTKGDRVSVDITLFEAFAGPIELTVKALNATVAAETPK